MRYPRLDGVDRICFANATRSWFPMSPRPKRVSLAIRTGGCCRSSTRRSSSVCSATCSTRTSFWGRTAFVRSRGITWSIRSCFTSVVRNIKVQYLPAESNTGMFGGNSNWRGPVWMPVNALILRALMNLYSFYGDEFKVQCPTGSGQLHDAVRSGAGDRPAADEHVPARCQWTTAGLRRDGQVPGGSALARSDPVL